MDGNTRINMRDRREVQAEIDWREKEIKRLKEDIAYNQTEEYNKWRIENLTYAVAWCKWFLKEE